MYTERMLSFTALSPKREGQLFPLALWELSIANKHATTTTTETSLNRVNIITTLGMFVSVCCIVYFQVIKYLRSDFFMLSFGHNAIGEWIMTCVNSPT